LPRKNSWDDRIETITKHVTVLFKRASIVIITFNNLDYNRLCLQSIYDKTSYPDLSTRRRQQLHRWHTGVSEAVRTDPSQVVRVILNDSNVGFAAANNQALDVASGEYVIFLNNDTMSRQAGSRGSFIYLGDPSIGMVGPVTNWSGNESKIDVPYASAEGIDAFASEYVRQHVGETFDIQTLALFCAAIRRSTIDSVGRLDERFGIGMFEDDDYALRVRGLGLKVICAEDVFIHHWVAPASRGLIEDFYRKLFDENRRKFEEKMGTKWEPHRAKRHAVKRQRHFPADVADASPWQRRYRNFRDGRAPAGHSNGHCKAESHVSRSLRGASSRCATDSRRTRLCWGTAVICVTASMRPTAQRSAAKRRRVWYCESTVRVRAVVDILSNRLLGASLPLSSFPRRKDLIGLGLSDSHSLRHRTEARLWLPQHVLAPNVRASTCWTHPPRWLDRWTFSWRARSSSMCGHQYRARFIAARRLIKPGGVLVITTPYDATPGAQTLEHYPRLHDFDLSTNAVD